MENQISKNQTNPQFVITKSPKSVGISILLTLLLGSLGLFYSTISGGLVMTFLFPPAIVLLVFSAKIIPATILSVFYYPLCIYLGIRAVKNYNTKLLSGADVEEKLDYSFGELIQYALIIIFALCGIYAISDLFF